MNHQQGQEQVEQVDKATNENQDLPGNQQVLPVPGDGDRLMDDSNKELIEKSADKKDQIVSFVHCL